MNIARWCTHPVTRRLLHLHLAPFGNLNLSPVYQDELALRLRGEQTRLLSGQNPPYSCLHAMISSPCMDFFDQGFYCQVRY